MDQDLVDSVMAGLNASPTPYHAVATLAQRLEDQGFTRLQETEPWALTPGGGHYVVREFGSLIAFVLPRTPHPAPLRMACAHTDSPVLKLKPNPLKRKREHLVFDIEVYGGVIQPSWFDRDLSLAGLVSVQDGAFELHHRLLDCKLPLARIPHLAIHLNRGINDSFKANPQEEMTPIFRELAAKESREPLELFRDFLLESLAQQGEVVAGWVPLDWDLMFYDTQPACRVGREGAWLAGARLDNLLSCFTGVEALERHARQGGEALAMVACFNHEEVGSLSSTGAAGNFVEAVVRRLYPLEEERLRLMSASWLLSLDNAHGYHPNYPAQQDENHAPRLQQGIVIKHNANQRYATSALSGGFVKGLCRQAGVGWQEFVVRADMGCGSTVGPMVSARLGMRGADIGLPTWAMHSIRETAGGHDLAAMTKILELFFRV